MRLFLKILFFIFIMLIATVGEVHSSTVVNVFQEETSYFIFQESQLTIDILKNQSEDSCLNGKNVVTCSEQVISINGSAAKTGGKELYNFTGKAASRMSESGRAIPVQTLDDIIKAPLSIAKDPQGTNALMNYSQM